MKGQNTFHAIGRRSHLTHRGTPRQVTSLFSVSPSTKWGGLPNSCHMGLSYRSYELVGRHPVSCRCPQMWLPHSSPTWAWASPAGTAGELGRTWRVGGRETRPWQADWGRTPLSTGSARCFRPDLCQQAGYEELHDHRGDLSIPHSQHHQRPPMAHPGLLCPHWGRVSGCPTGTSRVWPNP